MKTSSMNNLLSFCVGLLIAFCQFGVVLGGNSIVDIAKGNDDFDILVNALKKTELDEILDTDGPFTVLAPTDDAFKALFKKLGVKNLTELDTETVTQVLLYHVIAGKVLSGDLSDGKVETVGGQKVMVDVSHEGVFFNDAQVVAADIEASNGVIHVIDSVLLPAMDKEHHAEEEDGSMPSIVELVLEDGRFNTLRKCLQRAGLVQAIVDAKDITVFAPNNLAFENLFHKLHIGGCGDLETKDLQEVLLYHVVGDVAFAEDLRDGMKLETLQGDKVRINFRRYGRKVFVNRSKVIDADLAASNGVIHAIDKVLLPW